MWDFKRWTFSTLTELPFCPSRLKVPLLMVDGWTLGFTNFLCCSLWSSFSVSPLSLHSTNGSLFSAGWRLVLRLSSGCSEGAAVAVVITQIGKLGVCRAQTAAGAVLRFIRILRSSRLLRGFHLNPPSVFFLVCAFRVLINVTSTMHFCQHTS